MKRLELPSEGGPWSFRRFSDRAKAWASFEHLEPDTPPPRQLDEPWLSTLVDPKFRAKEGVTNPAYEMDLCVDLINQTVDQPAKFYR